MEHIARVYDFIKYGMHEPFAHLFQGDCLDLFESVPDQSVDLLVCDPPYEATAAKWDKKLPFDQFWPEVERVLKPTGVCLVFASQPFTTDVIASNRKMFRNIWYWQKDKSTGHHLTGRQPLRVIEEICVFGRRALSGATYNPQKTKREKPYRRSMKRSASKVYKPSPWSRSGDAEQKVYDEVFPTHLLTFPREKKPIVETQKPVDLLKYFVKTYSNPGDVILDPTMGAGTTGVAALELDRSFIGFEMDADHFAKASARIETTKAGLPRFDLLSDEVVTLILDDIARKAA